MIPGKLLYCKQNCDKLWYHQWYTKYLRWHTNLESYNT